MSGVSATASRPAAPGRVEDLRARARTDPAGAREEAWSWFEELGRRRATDELDDLFRQGRPPEGLDGPTDGILVMTQIQRLADPAIRALTRVWMPWMGKRIDPLTATGDNRFISSARFVVKALWPGYRMKPSEEGTEGRLAFDFETRVEPSADDPATEVLVIDYAPVESNPDRLIRKIRDELVEIVPGANLGKVLHRNPDGSYRNWGFFALRPRG